MKLSLVSILKNFLVEDIDPPAFIPEEVMILKTLNRIQKSAKTKDNIVLELKKILTNLGFSVDEALYYYYTWVQNYRPDAKYADIKKSEFKSMAGLKGDKTTNVGMSQYAKSKIPFKGSNVEGYWERNAKGDDQYVITSFGWYPIYLFRDGKWYKTSEHYSSSTGRHISNTNIGYRGQGITSLTPQEMNQLRSGVPVDRILNDKTNSNLKFFESYVGKTFFTKKDFSEWTNVPYNGGLLVGDFRMKWKLKDVKLENNVIIFECELLSIDKVSYSNKILERDFPLDLTNDLLRKKLEEAIGWFIARKDENYKKLDPYSDYQVKLTDTRQ